MESYRDYSIRISNHREMVLGIGFFLGDRKVAFKYLIWSREIFARLRDGSFNLLRSSAANVITAGQ